MGYIVSSFVFRGKHCQTLQLTLGIFYVLTTAFTALLFLLHVIAVWIMNKWIIASFTILWVSTVGGAVTVPFGISGGHIGPACINTQIDSYAQSAAIVPKIYDSAVFLAITYRILMNSLLEEAPSTRFQTFFGRGRAFLPTLSRNLLRSGQHYYLVALSGHNCQSCDAEHTYDSSILSWVVHHPCTCNHQYHGLYCLQTDQVWINYCRWFFQLPVFWDPKQHHVFQSIVNKGTKSLAMATQFKMKVKNKQGQKLVHSFFFAISP
ncbi:hypothetical protein L218DRAFT_1046070, partial [Marasmius fiardii PR-910]